MSCRVNGVDSGIGNIDVGVPQGTYFCTLLFLIYTNDLPHAVNDFNVSMYADDTSLCYQCDNITLQNNPIKNDLKKLDIWLQRDKLSLNVIKTHSMLVSTKQKQNILKTRNDVLKVPLCAN